MIKKFDIFPKAADNELKVRTNTGGILTIVSVIFLMWCIFSEVQKYTTIRVNVQMVLNDQPLPPTLPFLVDANVYNNCSDLHFEITNTKRTIDISSKVNRNFEQKNGYCHVVVNGVTANVPASFHIGLGESYISDTGAHQHLWFVLNDKNLTHKINRLQFGEVEIASPIDNFEFSLPKQAAYMITYNLQLVPFAENEKTGYLAIASQSKTNLDKIRTRGITAIIFEWNFSPIGLQRSANHEPIINLFSHLLALCGCFFVFVRFIDTIVFSISH